MNGVGSSSSSSGGGAASRQHSCGVLCEHPLLKPRDIKASRTERNDRCATAHILHSLSARGGNEESSESFAALLRALIHPSIVAGELGSESLVSATARALGCTPARVTGSINKTLEGGLGEGQNAIRADAMDKMLVYYYIHGILGVETPAGNICIDVCPLVEIAKNYSSEWKGKGWVAPWGPMKLTCKPHLRRGSLFEIAETFLNSETYRE